MKPSKPLQNPVVTLIACFIMILGGVGAIVLGIQEMSSTEDIPAGVITPQQAMRARLDSFPLVEGKLDIIMQTDGIKGEGAICTFEGEKNLVVNVPPGHRVARSIQRADARLDRKWRLRGLLESGSVSSIAMWQFLEETKLEKRNIRVLNRCV